MELGALAGRIMQEWIYSDDYVLQSFTGHVPESSDHPE